MARYVFTLKKREYRYAVYIQFGVMALTEKSAPNTTCNIYAIETPAESNGAAVACVSWLVHVINGSIGTEQN